MSRKYLSVAETAKLVRAALKESFPGVKFSVRSSSYSGGASIDVYWTDGPNGAQAAAEQAAKLLNKAQRLNHRERKYTAAARAIAEGFEWNELEEIGSQGGES